MQMILICRAGEKPIPKVSNKVQGKDHKKKNGGNHFHKLQGGGDQRFPNCVDPRPHQTNYGPEKKEKQRAPMGHWRGKELRITPRGKKKKKTASKQGPKILESVVFLWGGRQKGIAEAATAQQVEVTAGIGKGQREKGSRLEEVKDQCSNHGKGGVFPGIRAKHQNNTKRREKRERETNGECTGGKTRKTVQTT